jgi:hypothetical protein
MDERIGTSRERNVQKILSLNMDVVYVVYRVYIIDLNTKFHIPGFGGSSVIAIECNAKYIFDLLFYLKVTTLKCVASSPTFYCY